MTAVVTLEEVLTQARQLSPADQLRLIQQVAENLTPSIPPQVAEADEGNNGASSLSWLPAMRELSDEEYAREMEAFDRLLEENAIDTGIPDLA